MNAEKFFEKYSIEEISQKTKISPISLRFIRNKEFEKLPRAKFFGFLNIIEKEFKVDLSDLKEEYNALNITQKEQPKEIQIEKEKSSHNYILTLSALIFLVIGAFLLYKTLNKNSNLNSQDNLTSDNNISVTQKVSDNQKEKNLTFQTLPTKTTNEKNSTTANQEINKTLTSNVKITSNNANNSSNEKKVIQKYKVIIIPNERVWYKAINIDTNKTTQYLTSQEKILPKGNYYIKFGHGNVKIIYANKTIEPKTKKIVRILLKDGNYTFLKKPNRYEK